MKKIDKGFCFECFIWFCALVVICLFLFFTIGCKGGDGDSKTLTEPFDTMGYLVEVPDEITIPPTNDVTVGHEPTHDGEVLITLPTQEETAFCHVYDPALDAYVTTEARCERWNCEN